MITARLHGGPLHNKVTIIPTGQRTTYIETAKIEPFAFNDWKNDAEAAVNYNRRTLEYRMLVIQNPFNPSETIPCVNPKGEVFFKFVK